MPIIKDKEYWKNYNQKRKEKGYFQQNYLQRKGVVKSEIVVKSLQPDREIEKAEEKSLQNSLQPEILQPNLQPAEKVVNNILQPLLLCRTCPNLNTKYGTNKTYCLNCDLKTKKQEIVPLGLVQQLQEKVKELEQPINLTIELWKKRYFDLKKEFHEKGKEQTETIQRLKEKLREKYTENKQLIEKYAKLENQRQNSNNFLSMPNLYALISKHKKFQTIQHVYNHQEIKEREFLRKLLNELWSFAG